MWLPMHSTLPTVILKNKQQANKQKTKHLTLNSPLFCVRPFHCEPIPCLTTSKSIKCQLLSMWRAPWQPGPSNFLCFLSPITLWSLSGSPEDVTVSGFPSPPNFMLSNLQCYLSLHSSSLSSTAIPPSSYSSNQHTGEQVPLSCMLEGSYLAGTSVLCPKHVKAMLRATLYLTADTYWHRHAPETEKEGSIPSDTWVLLGQQNNWGLLGSSAHWA